MIDLIGTNAGLVWHALNESKGGLTVREIQKNSGVRTQNEIYMALGWLAKEGKVIFSSTDKDFKVTLAE